MKSIRHTLIVYFLVLVTGALAAVSWSSYRTTAQALRQRQNDSQKLILQQCQAHCDQVRDELDRRLLLQAWTMARMRLVTPHYEATFALNAILAAPMPQGFVTAAAWSPYIKPNVPPKDGMPPTPIYRPMWAVPESKNPESAREFFALFSKAFPRHRHLESSQFVVANPDSDHPQEYFQTYGADGHPFERSASMGDTWFTLDKDLREKTTLFSHHFDEVEIRPGVKVRRVTLNTPVSEFGGMWIPWGGRAGGKGPKSPTPPATPGPSGAKTPTVFIQYASELGLIDEKIHQFQRERDEQLASLTDTIEQDLSQLRYRMFWISLGSLVAILLGGYGVIRLGLNPLAKMTEAVRKISPINFHLALDPDKLPQELQPIATRIEESLQELRKAFAREKQAAADISHELRTPLAALMTTLEVGLKKNRSSAEYIEILDECRLSGQHMYQLVERLLTLARLDAGADQYRPGDVDVTETALNCADLIRPLARARGLDLRLHLPDPIAMRTDGSKLREVLVNLLHNAVEYNKPHGSIELSVERINGHVRLEVRDAGIGIKPDVMSHIFERFYRADSSRHADTPHAGLGLAIVKSYVDLMGGTIGVESGDAGTAFIVELPFVQTAVTAIREPVRA
jgi:signal transduction histidine kinase